MPYVITDSCIGVCDTACVDVCPVDCIHGPLAVADVRALDARQRTRLSLQMYIDAEACICCAACVPECPVEAIVESESLPADSPAIRRADQFFRAR